MREDGHVHSELREQIAILTIDNPPANAVSVATLQALDRALCSVLGTPAAKVVILTAAGEMGCAGADVRELAALQGRAAAEVLSQKGQAVADLMEGASKPVIGAIGGRYVLGGGNELFMACHLRLVEERTQLGSPEVLLGLMVGWGGSQRLPRLIGLGRASELLLTGRRIGAKEAYDMGLVNRVAADGTVLDEARRIAGQLARLSAPVLAATLAALRVGVRDGYRAGCAAEQASFAALCDNEDWREGTTAFLEKRQPRFRDG